MEVVKGRVYVYSIQYHIVWCVKYHRDVLNGQVAIKLKELLTQISKDNGFQILEMNMEEDHIHMLINCTPQHYIPNIIKAMKGVSARLLMKEFEDDLRSKLWGGHLWNPSYFVATVSENTEEQIIDYIRSQKKKIANQ
ncbi:MAG: IS200/IS605 family transposase [Holdemanella porci]|uniref:IS200/IS605 family transposase n=1 Tax=Holdemanella porci TaxID=2652276 RepID=UPI003994A4C6